MRKIVLLAFSAALAIAPVALPQLVAPAYAESIYCGGSHEPGLVPWHGRTSLGPYGVQPGCGGHRGNGYQYGGAYYHAHGERQVTGGQLVVQHYTICHYHPFEMINGRKVYGPTRDVVRPFGSAC